MPRIPARALVLVMVLALTQPGCLALMAGIAGGAVAYTVYVDGSLVAVYNATGDETWAAIHKGLAELGMKVTSEEHQVISSVVETMTAEGYAVRIGMKTNLGRNPGGTPQTRVDIRIGTFGDRAMSERIMDQIGSHLVAVGNVPPGAASAALPVTPAPPTPLGPPVREPQPVDAAPRLVPTPVR